MIAQALVAPPFLTASASKITAFAPVLQALPGDRARDHADAAITAISGEIGRQLSADCLLISWHTHDVSTTLAVSGDPVAPEMLEMSGCAARAKLGAAAENTWFTSESNVGELLTTAIAVAGGSVTVTALYRRFGALSQRDVRQAASNLLPIVSPYFRLWADQRCSLRRTRGLSDALNNSDVGVMLVDRSARLVFANSIAKVMLADGSSIRQQAGDILVTKTLADTLRLHAAIDHVVSAGRNRGCGTAPASPVLAIARDNRRALMAAIISGDETGEGDNELAIVYLFDPEEDSQLYLEPACSLYGLSPVEAKLTCLLADGMSLSEAAERMHIRELTARSYLKQVFQKTDTKRQAELVWLMLKSTVRTARGYPVGLI